MRHGIVIMNNLKSSSNGDRRKGADRRRYSFGVHIPERRSGSERRNRFAEKYESIFSRYDVEYNKTCH